MKRLLLIFLFLSSVSLTFGAFVDFFCDAANGDNINGGSSTATSVYTSTNGNWSTVTNIFTPTDGSNPSTASPACTVGDYASIYNDGATLAVYIAKITAVQNATNGTITVSSTLKAGSAPTTSATGRSIKCGGVWKGPNAASSFPLNLSLLPNLAATTDKLCINLKNNSTYSVTAGITETGSQNVEVRGYSSSVRDGGRAVIDGGQSGAAYTLLTSSASAGWAHVDLIFDHNGATSTAAGVTATSGISALTTFTRCVFRNMRGPGAQISQCTECEAYGNNTGSASNTAGFVCNSPAVFVRCYSHDNSTGTTNGFYINSSGTFNSFVECISDSNSGDGFHIETTTAFNYLVNCDGYNNTGDGLQLGSATANTGMDWVENCNWIKNGGWGINASERSATFVYNNGFGAGTQVNGSGTTTGLPTGAESGSITYAGNVTPWNAPSTGDFSINLSAAQGVGRGAFTQLDGTNTGTVGYPDIGAAQAQVGTAFPTPTPTPTATATSTPTPTPTSPPEASHTFGG